MTKRALIVDDNRSLAEDLGEILEGEGYEVVVFDNPFDALRAAPGLRFDVAVLDVRMPGMDGVSLHQELLAQHSHAAFILMTAYTEDDRIAQALSAGVRCVLTKPVPLPHLLRAIENADHSTRELLLVDDDNAFLACLGELLRDSGYKVREASSARQARELFESGLLASIVDIHLPDGDGMELGIELARASAAPVVLITGFDLDQHENRLLQQFGKRARLLMKPFSPVALLAVLTEIREATS